MYENCTWEVYPLLFGILLVCLVAGSECDCLSALALSGPEVSSMGLQTAPNRRTSLRGVIKLLELLHPCQTEMLMQHFAL